jgi:hypothetical protein
MEIVERMPALPAPKKKRKKARKTPRRASFHKPAATKAPDQLAGLSASDCPFDCNAEKCLISGMAICGHPGKGGLQSAMQNDPEAMARYNQARKILAHQKVDKKG